MSLDKTILSNFFKGTSFKYTTIASAAQAWADAYDSYANGGPSYAQDQSGDKVTTVSKSALQNGLVVAFTNSDSASEAASYINTAVRAYWTGAIFAIAIPPTVVDPTAISDISSVVNNTGSYNLQGNLQSEFEINSANANTKATALANIFDAHAKSVTTLCTYNAINPSPPPATIVKTCTLTVS